MQIRNGYANTGLVSLNYSLLNKMNSKFQGRAIGNLDKEGTAKIRPLSAEALKVLEQQKMSSPRILNVDSSEIVNNVYSDTGSNTSYNIDGIKFTNDEMQACKEVVKNAIAELPKKGSSLDYSDYALMGIASNMVSRYANEHLTKDQAEIVNKSMKEYIDSLMQAEKASQERSGCFTDHTEGVGSTGELNTYYSTRSRLRLSEEQKEDFRRMVAHLPEGTRYRLLANLEAAEKNGSVVQSASNEEYAESIRSTFQEADLTDDASVNVALKKYQKLMTPVYTAAGLMNVFGNQALASIMNWDSDKFLSYISSMKAVVENIGNNRLDYYA